MQSFWFPRKIKLLWLHSDFYFMALLACLVLLCVALHCMVLPIVIALLAPCFTFLWGIASPCIALHQPALPIVISHASEHRGHWIPPMLMWLRRNMIQVDGTRFYDKDFGIRWSNATKSGVDWEWCFSPCLLHPLNLGLPCSSSPKPSTTYFIFLCSQATLAFLEAKRRLLRQFRPRHKSPAARRSEESRKSTLFVSTRASCELGAGELGRESTVVVTRRRRRSGRRWVGSVCSKPYLGSHSYQDSIGHS